VAASWYTPIEGSTVARPRSPIAGNVMNAAAHAYPRCSYPYRNIISPKWVIK
jgi:hypothetical protein